MKRFYSAAEARQAEAGWQVQLDGRPLKTQAGAQQIVPTQALGQAMAEEWSAQGETIDPKALILRDLADLAIDRIAPAPDATIEALARFVDGETLCYRADAGSSLAERQDAMWEPILRAIEDSEGVRFERLQGVIHQDQPAATKEAIRARLAKQCPFALAGLLMAAELTASICTAFALQAEPQRASELWDAANLEEDWQADQWGWDTEAKAVRDAKAASFALAGRYLALLSG